MGTWYYAVDGAAVGPVERDDLVTLAMDGTLGPDTQVLDAGSTTWRTLAEAEDDLGVAFPLFAVPGTATETVPPAGPPPVGAGWAAPTAPPPMLPPPVAGTGVRLAAWWRRAVAYWIDSLLFSIPLAVLVFPDVDDITTFEQLVTYASTSRFVALQAGVAAASLVYQVVFNAQGQTLGKRLLGIRVEDAVTGSRIGLGRAFQRQVLQIATPLFVPYVGQIFVVVDSLWPLWDARNQALHDKIARSVVVRVG